MDAMMPNTGMSARDLVGKTILRLLEKDKWRSASSDEELFKQAYVMLWHAFLDLVKKKEYKQTVITESIDAKQSESLLATQSSMNTVLEAAEAEALVTSLQAVIGDDEKVKAYLYLWLRRRITKREDIAYLLGVSEREATDIRRRLLYKLRLSPVVAKLRERSS
jgi:hypothetical protein